MEVILNQDVDKIGRAGTVVKVKDGFARNFLIPNGLAIPLTNQNLKKLEQEKQKRAIQLEKSRKEAEALKERLSTLSLTISALAHEEEKLYGSIAAVDIASALKEEGFDIDKSCIALEKPIHSLGIYEVPVNLHPQVSAKVKVWVVGMKK